MSNYKAKVTVANLVSQKLKGLTMPRASSFSRLLYALGLGCALIAVIFALVGLTETSFELGNWLFLAAAVLCSATGFLLQGLAWGFNVRVVHQRYSLLDALQQHCSTIFMKYIPGKVIAVVGRAWLASKSLCISPKGISVISFLDVIFSTVVGLLLGFSLLLFERQLDIVVGAKIGSFVALLGVIAAFVSLPFLSRRFFFVRPQRKFLLLSACIFSGGWFVWALGFSLLLASFEGVAFDLKNGSMFIVAVCMSLFVAVVPGGIGIREGFLTTGLMLNGFDQYESAAFALLARLWFCAGEGLVYLFSILYGRAKT